MRADRIALLLLATLAADCALAQESVLRGYAEPRLSDELLRGATASWSNDNGTRLTEQLPESRPWAQVWQLEPQPPSPEAWRVENGDRLFASPPVSKQVQLAAHRSAPPPPPAADTATPPADQPEPPGALAAVSENDAVLTTLSGYAEFELRYFMHRALDPRQADSHPSVALEPEIYREWNDGHDALTITPFMRVDRRDSKRSHADLREANWLHVDDGWQLRLGLGKVFWGAVESQHLVDIINQTDTLEGVDGEDKLGQPMLNLVWLLGDGELSLFWLPYFREREFAGIEGRPRTQPRIDASQSRYQSSREEQHQDFAVRWSTSIDVVDIALSHFHGTSREPQLQAGNDGDGNPVLIPFYPVIDQTALELTAALGDWLWKLEAIRREGFGDTFHAGVGGFEYTLVGLFDSDLDLGLLLEYHIDERDQQATTPFQNDTFAGLRLTFNDFQSSELLAGFIYDHDSDATLGFVEASRRLGEAFKLSLELRLFDELDPDDPLFSFRDDDFLQLNLAYYF